MRRRIPGTCLLTLALAALALPCLAQGQPVQTSPPSTATAGTDWTYRSEVFELDLKWRRHLEANLRWMIARERLDAGRRVPRVAVFADAGTNHLLNRNIVKLLESGGTRCLVMDRSRISSKQLSGIGAYIVPGGFSTFQNAATGDTGLAAIREFVESGGRYLGICAGAYMATRDVFWEEEHFPYPLDLYDGTAEGALDDVAAWPGDTGVSLKLTEAGRLRGLEAEAEGKFYYKGGPRFHGGTNFTVLARYQDGSAAIITRPFGNGEVVLNGIHYERSPPRQDDDRTDPPAPDPSRAIFQALLQLESNPRPGAPLEVDRDLTRWLKGDLSVNDRVNLEQNLRWMLARTLVGDQESRQPGVALFADAGAGHQGLVNLVTFLEAKGIPVQPMLHTDLKKNQLKQIKTIIVPAGDQRILRETLGKQEHQALAEFVDLGGQFIALATRDYLAASTRDWLEQSQASSRQFPDGTKGIARKLGQGEVVLFEGNDGGQFLLELLSGRKQR
jgi:glutamine amidotransferase-like uncharacterized protein